MKVWHSREVRLLEAVLITLVVLLLLTGGDVPKPAPQYGYTVINTYPHDPSAFTQGLVINNGNLYEGTGLYDHSTLRRVDLTTGEVLQEYRLPDRYFGEGITVFGNRIIQLTWKSRIGFVYDKTTFKLLRQFTYPTEGWGITTDGRRLIMSDGTANLYFMNPETFKITGKITVHASVPVENLNELEYVDGEIYANVWQTNDIAMINPDTGQVDGWINLTGIYRQTNPDPNSVLNGIAFDPNGHKLYVTGKLWSELFQIQIVPPAQ